jgi:hypothetical protein
VALATTILNQIRDEIGSDTDYTDGALEEIYVDENRGNYSTLNTALIVWKRRLGDLQARSFDVTTEGSLLARSQRIRFIERRIKELEFDADHTRKSTNSTVKTRQSAETGSSDYSYPGGEF